MKKHSFLTLFGVLFLVSCQTAEEVRQRRLVENLASKMEESEKKLGQSSIDSASINLRIQGIEESVTRMRGDLDESVIKFDTNSSESHQFRQNATDRLLQMEKEIKQIKKIQEEQKKYLQNVLKTLKTLSKKGTPASLKTESYDNAIALFRKQKYDASLEMMQNLINNNKVSGKKKEHLWHNLGQIYLMKNHLDNALVSFSKVYSQTPKSPYAPNALLSIGKILKKQGKKEEAKEAFQKVIAEYPKSKRVPEAKKLLH